MDSTNVKIDLLATLNLTRMRTCLDLLAQYGYIEKKATLRETYEAAIGVYNLNRNNVEMWERLANNEILSVFQFDTPQGIQGISLAKPTSVEEMAALNSIMRLMASEKGAEQPLEKYARFKRNPKLWEDEMNQYSLTEEQKALLHNYLDYEYGICASQEDIMSMIQNPELGGWSLKDSDMLRKSIAKKDPKLYEELSQKYFDTVKEKSLDEGLCKYFWNVLVNTQRGYSFNLSHTLAYSLVGLQNINLACNFPTIFWNTANLIVDSAGVDDETDAAEIDQDEVAENNGVVEEEDEEEGEEETPTKEKVKRAKKTIDYGKIARAIGRFRSYGINIVPPNVNTSNYTFTPDVGKNSIIYGLHGIARISNDIIKSVIKNRPYSSFKDFLIKNHTSTVPTVNLIKSGAFDDIEGIPRQEIMKNYLESIADKKQKLTLQNMQMLINKGLIPEEMSFYAKLFLFNKFLKSHKNGDYYDLTDKAIDFIAANFDVDIIDNGTSISQKIWDNVYKKAMEPMRVYLKDNMDTLLTKLNDSLYKDVEEKYGKGSISKWEMESISFYYHEHELECVKDEYDDFFKMSEEPEVDYSFIGNNGQEVKVFKLKKIIGTVIDKNKLKNTISLLTPTGVVQVKIYKNQYSLFDKQISQLKPEGGKKVIEKSWFSRGTMLMIQGIRRGQDFIPKKRKDSVFPIITKILEVDEKGHLSFQYERSIVE